MDTIQVYNALIEEELSLFLTWSRKIRARGAQSVVLMKRTTSVTLHSSGLVSKHNFWGGSVLEVYKHTDRVSQTEISQLKWRGSQLILTLTTEAEKKRYRTWTFHKRKNWQFSCRFHRELQFRSRWKHHSKYNWNGLVWQREAFVFDRREERQGSQSQPGCWLYVLRGYSI